MTVSARLLKLSLKLLEKQKLLTVYSTQINTMYAIIADGGRQYKVEEGQELDIDLRDAGSGDEITFDQVLAVSGDDGVKVGQPVVEGASVTAEVLAEVKGDKIYVQKFRRRKDSKRRTVHRQRYTRIRVSKISG